MNIEVVNLISARVKFALLRLNVNGSFRALLLLLLRQKLTAKNNVKSDIKHKAINQSINRILFKFQKLNNDIFDIFGFEIIVCRYIIY